MKGFLFRRRQKARTVKIKKDRNIIGNLEWRLVAVVLGLCFFGLLMVYNASSAIAVRDFGDKYHFLLEQGKWLSIGLVGMAVMAIFDYRKFYYLSVPLLLGALILLGAVFVPGLGLRAMGAHRWINLGFISFQPAEMAKLAVIIYLAAWFSNKEKGRIWAFLILLGMVGGLIFLEPDMGTSMVIMIVGLMMYFLSGGPILSFLILIPVGMGLIWLLIKSAPYRLERFLTFLDPLRDPLGKSYHISQALIAIGSGGLWGLGLGQSRQKYEYLPEAMTDSIFAISAEEIGFFGSVFLILAFCMVIVLGWKIAKQAPDSFGFLLATGISVWLGIQIFINLGAMTALIPLTGVPLPFISYGGTALVVELTGIGILLNISRQGVKNK